MTTLLYWMLGISGTIVGLAILIGLFFLISRWKPTLDSLRNFNFKEMLGVLIGWVIFVASLIIVTGDPSFLWAKEFLAIILVSIGVLYVLNVYAPWGCRWSRKIAYVVMVIFLLVLVWQLANKTFPGVLPEVKAIIAQQQNENVSFFEFDGKGELFITELQPNQKIVLRKAAGGIIHDPAEGKESPLCGYDYKNIGFTPEKGDLRNFHLDLYPRIRPEAILAVLRGEEDEEDQEKDILLNWPCHSSLNDPFVIKNTDGRPRKVYIKYNYQWPEDLDSKTVLLLTLEKPR